MSRYMTVAQVADDLGFSPRTILRWIDAGHLEAVRLPGGRLRIPQTALETMLAGCATATRPHMVAIQEVDDADGQ